MISLGSEVVIFSMNSARRLLMALQIMDKRDLQELGILDIVMELQTVVKQHDYEDHYA